MTELLLSTKTLRRNAIADDSSVRLWHEPGSSVLGLQISVKGGEAISVALTRDDGACRKFEELTACEAYGRLCPLLSGGGP